MKSEDIASVKLHREEMIDTYVEAIRKVGGCPSHFLKKINEMTVAEMIDVLAQNGVRFTTVEKDKKSDHSNELRDRRRFEFY